MNSEIATAARRTAVAALLAATCLGLAAPATADEPVTPKPKGGVKQGSISFQHYYDKASVVIMRDGSRQTGRFAGVIHLGGQVALDADGQPSEIDIHANVSDAVATLPGSSSFRVTGSYRDIKPPQICALPPQLCPLPVPLTFTLADGPDGSPGRSVLELPLALTFDDSWNLVDVQPVESGLE